jgi:ABC-type transport system involved in cytochrome c biogenesis permease subunit
MQEMSIFWLRVAVALYGVGMVHAILTVLHRPSRIFPFALGSFCVGVILHLVALVELGVALGHLPLDNFFESMSVCAFLIAVLFLFVYWRYQFTGLSVFLFPLVFLMALVGAMEIPVASWTDERVRDLWLLVHVLLVLLGYAALLLTAVASIIYLMQERQLKRKSRIGLLEKMPPLGTLDTIITKTMGLAFVFITLSVVAGSTWAFIESGTRWIGDPKVTISLITWGFYLVMVFLRTAAGWRGRKAALLVLTVVCCSALTWAAHVGLRPMLVQ